MLTRSLTGFRVWQCDNREPTACRCFPFAHSSGEHTFLIPGTSRFFPAYCMKASNRVGFSVALRAGFDLVRW